MAILNDWQKLKRISPFFPWGNGSEGDYASASIPSYDNEYISATSGTTSGTLGGSAFADGDLVFLHQTRGTGAGQYEVNSVASGGGTSSLTFSRELQYTYTYSGASVAQIVNVHQYQDVTVSSGTWSVPIWSHSTGTGGVFVMAVKGTLTIVGNIDADGNDGTSTPAAGPRPGGQGCGFWGGDAAAAAPYTNSSTQGESDNGTGTHSTSNNASGGGAGNVDAVDGAGGGGAGHATAGTIGDVYSGTPGQGGSVTGDSADLTKIEFGAGGGGADRNQNSAGSGGGGGGIVIIFAKNVVFSGGNILLRGGSGGGSDVSYGYGGGGAGGSCLIVCQTGTFGTNKILAYGSGGYSTYGQGGDGRIAIHHAEDITGSTNPSFEDISDSDLKEVAITGSILY